MVPVVCNFSLWKSLPTLTPFQGLSFPCHAHQVTPTEPVVKKIESHHCLKMNINPSVPHHSVRAEEASWVRSETSSKRKSSGLLKKHLWDMIQEASSKRNVFKERGEKALRFLFGKSTFGTTNSPGTKVFAATIPARSAVPAHPPRNRKSLGESRFDSIYLPPRRRWAAQDRRRSGVSFGSRFQR
ncbi:hypothetical protein L345_12842, partial [Ophiophagus hannah]